MANVRRLVVAMTVVWSLSLAPVAHAQPPAAPESPAPDPAPGTPTSPPPPPPHTGFRALFTETGRDFASFPRRRSTWVILGIGGAAAALAHPEDHDVNARLVSSGWSHDFFAAGNHIGAAYTQAGAAVGLYLVGRYVLPHAAGSPRSNKVSHLGARQPALPE